MTGYAQILFLMIAGHALCDVPLQPERLSRAKHDRQLVWRMQALLAHGLIHGGAVALITGLWWLGAAETAAHMAIDNAKARGRIGHAADQALHAVCKMVWAALAVWA